MREQPCPHSRETASRGLVSARKDVSGEGSYTPSREFRRDQTRFVQRHKNPIPPMGEEAAEALVGGELRRTGETARADSAGDEQLKPTRS